MAEGKNDRPVFGDPHLLALKGMNADQRRRLLSQPDGDRARLRPDVFTEEELEQWFQPSRDDPTVFVPKENIPLQHWTLPAETNKYGNWYNGPKTKVLGKIDESTLVDVLAFKRPAVVNDQTLGPAPSWMVRNRVGPQTEYFVARRGTMFIGVNGTK